MTDVDYVYVKYMKVRFPLPTQAMVNELEQKLGIRLPSAYCTFLLQYNGGYFNSPEFLVPGNNGFVDGLDVLRGFNAPNDSVAIGTTQSIEIFDENDPVILLPIGYTVKGNLIYMFVDDTDEDLYGYIDIQVAWRDESYSLASSIDEMFSLIMPHGKH